MKTNFVWRILLIGLLLSGVTTVEAGKPVKNLYLCIFAECIFTECGRKV